MKKLPFILLVFILIAKDTKAMNNCDSFLYNPYIMKGNCFINLKSGFAVSAWVIKNSIKDPGYGTAAVPGFEYFISKGFSTMAGFNHNYSYSGGAGTVAANSMYLGAKCYWNLKRFSKTAKKNIMHTLSFHLGYQYGNISTIYFDSSQYNISWTGGNFFAGIGYERFPRRIFKRDNLSVGLFY